MSVASMPSESAYEEKYFIDYALARGSQAAIFTLNFSWGSKRHIYVTHFSSLLVICRMQVRIIYLLQISFQNYNDRP